MIFNKVFHFFRGKTRKRNRVLSLLLCIVIVACILLLIYGLKSDAVWETIVGSFLAVFCTSIFLPILSNFLANLEDSEKVSCDTKTLLSTYKYDPSYLKTLTLNGEKTTFLYHPLIAPNEASHLSFKVADKNENNFELTDLIANSASQLFSAHLNSEKAFEDMVRLDDYQVNEGVATFYTSRTNYFNHLLTNRAADYQIDNSFSLRDIYEHGPLISPLSKSKFSNHIGLNALVITADGYLFVPRRSITATISKNKVTSSIACGLQAGDINNINFDGDFLTRDVIFTKMFKRLPLKKELIKLADVDIHFLGCGQNIYEAGKPQFYYAIRLKNVNVNNVKNYVNKSNDQGKIDIDRKLYLIKMDDIKFMREEKIVLPGYLFKQNEPRRLKHPVKVRFERSFIVNYWYYQETKNH